VGTAAEDLGVKVREGRLEVKRRTSVVGDERWAVPVAGVVETWSKRGFELDSGARPPDWIAVRKKRRLVTFRVSAGRVVRAGRVGARSHGVGVELTEVTVRGVRWWTLGLESFGPGESARIEALRKVAAHVFAAEPPALPLVASMGYPGWLRGLAAQG
jgi:hypothetical protein